MVHIVDMDKATIIEIISGVLVVGLLVLFLNPFMFWMPSLLQYCALALVLAGFGLFGGVIWREQARDEREEFHAMRASRTAYLAGLLVLIIGAVYQALTNMIDVWIFATIAVMVAVKLAARIHGELTK